MDNFRRSVVIEKLLNLAREDNINWHGYVRESIGFCAWILKRNLVFRYIYLKKNSCWCFRIVNT